MNFYRKETMKMMKESVHFAMESEKAMMHKLMATGKRKFMRMFGH
jgi:hypothetical protein